MSRPPPLPRDRLAEYVEGDVIGGGGSSSVTLALHRPSGRIVALKRLWPAAVVDPERRASLVDEARLARWIRHPNVVAVHDILDDGEELMLVLDVVHGASVGTIARAALAAGEGVPVAIASAILCGVLAGLDAAHDAVDGAGAPLGIVHRDVSPENILVGADGVARVADFGIAKARDRAQQTREGTIKGKLAYMAPEQIMRGEVTRTADVFAASAVMWELIAGERLFAGSSALKVTEQVLYQRYQPLRDRLPELPVALDEALARGLGRPAGVRYPTARAFAAALADAVPPSPSHAVAGWVGRHVGELLAAHDAARRSLAARG